MKSDMLQCSVMLVDDHPLMRKGLNQLLEDEERFRVLADVSSGFEAVAKAKELEPELIVLDLNMKGMSGLDTLKALRADDSDAIIVVLTVSDSPSDIEAVLAAGADGYLLKDTEPEVLIEGLTKVLSGDKVYSAEVQDYLVGKTGIKTIFDRLTQRETQILQHVAKGYRNKQIAELLFISEATVKVHMKSLLKKLDVPSRTAATVLYLEQYGEAN
ncbi:Nitrate/nitrite response regulator protein NarL [Vibrio marisflavi CECT 7928]|uniref:Nitrate/nitrite response regulator protein NarL n=2 Tax=Vibrio marisflavi TaxID=1216040 RepID=A0ABM9A0M8_9VIBR|nr:Nitrate/nitrite response regulator protein NarL [Vibrio marisflavi CECT 7928]